MATESELATLSIRAPRQLREIITEACNATAQSKSEYMSTIGAMAAKGVLQHEKSLKLLPSWFKPIEDQRQMITITMPADDLEATKEAAARMLIPHTRFILWAVVLVALKTLGQKRVAQINQRLGLH